MTQQQQQQQQQQPSPPSGGQLLHRGVMAVQRQPWSPQQMPDSSAAAQQSPCQVPSSHGHATAGLQQDLQPAQGQAGWGHPRVQDGGIWGQPDATLSGGPSAADAAGQQAAEHGDVGQQDFLTTAQQAPQQQAGGGVHAQPLPAAAWLQQQDSQQAAQQLGQQQQAAPSPPPPLPPPLPDDPPPAGPPFNTSAGDMLAHCARRCLIASICLARSLQPYCENAHA